MNRIVLSRTLAVLLALAVPAVAVHADGPCPCVPKETTWIVTHCDTWDCAMQALTNANGDPYVIAMPTSSTTYRWVVIRRVTSGSVVVNPDEPFDLELFKSANDAALRHASIDSERAPMLLTTPDGVAVVVSLKNPPPRRAVRH